MIAIIFIIDRMNRSSTNGPALKRFQVVRSKFNRNTTRQLLQFLATINWSSSLSDICQQLYDITQQQLKGKYVWMVGTNPTYFIQYQIDSYAIIKGYGRVILVWKPKYLEYPSLMKLSQFGDQPKTIKSIQITTQKKNSQIGPTFESKLIQYINMYYGMHFFSKQQTQFQTQMLTQLKHYVSRISNASYWHCIIDSHNKVQVSSNGPLYIKIRIKGVKQQYDKDLVIFSQQGVRQFVLKGKGFQIVSFLAMLVIFIAVVSCPSDSQTGFCSHKNQMILAGAALMMGLMGMRVVSRNKQKKKLDKKISQIQKTE